jgi:amino acid adenylation domain-containing protein
VTGTSGTSKEADTPANHPVATAWSVEHLHALVARALGAESDEFSTDENLIEIGLTSIALMKIQSEIADAGLSLPFSALAQSPSVDDWIRLIGAHSNVAPLSTDEPSGTIEWPAADRHAPFPLTDIQRAYWLGREPHFELGGVAAHGYLEAETLDIDPDRLEEALNATIACSPMLSAIITDSGMQRILETVDRYRIGLEDLSGFGEDERQERLAATRAAMEQEVLPPDRWPLFNIRMSRISEDRHILHVSFDILVFDLKSLEIWIDLWWQHCNDPSISSAAAGAQFRDYVLDQQTRLGAVETQQARCYWQDRIDGLPLGPELPLALAVADIGVPQFQRHQTVLLREDWARLQEMIRTRGLTASVVLMAAYARALSTWSKSGHFTLTTTLFNRSSSTLDLDGVIGDFTSLVLVEVDTATSPSFIDLARAIRDRLWQDLDNSAVSGVEVLSMLSAARGAPNRALLPFVFTSALGTGRSYLDAFASFGEITRAAVQTPQTLLDHQALEHRGDLILNWDHVHTAFPAGLIEALSQSHFDLLQRLLTDDAAWDDAHLDLLSAPTRHQRREVNETGWVPGNDFKRLHDPFLHQAQVQPGAVALISGALSLTYQELDAASSRLAAEIIAHAPQREQLVAVLLPKGWQQIVAVLAILKAGAAYIPIDPSLPHRRIGVLLEQSRATLMLSLDGVEAPDHAGQQQVSRLAVGHRLLEDRNPVPALDDPAKTDDLAYVIFTSGSTGVPKGVMIEHGAALNTILDINARYGMTQHDRCLMVSSLSFDLSVYDIFGMLAAGGTVVVPAPSPAPDLEDWRHLVRQHGITVWNSVPALMQLLHDYLEDRGALADIASLRLVMLSGDWLPLPLCRAVLALPGPVLLVSLGGATEASIWSIAHTVHAIAPDWRSIPYGTPLANQTIHVLDARMEDRPDFAVGEIFIGGKGLARGYWADPQRTAKRFVTHPLTGERLYRTGDWGRWRPDGTVEFLGREDNQVKINGLRVELGEIEAALQQQRGIKQAVALVLRDGAHGDQLAAVVATDHAAIGKIAISQALSDHLPKSLVPTLLHAVHAMPLTANGKVDRAAAEALLMGLRSNTAISLRAPVSETEAKLCAIWSDLLSRDITGTNVNFFSAGGNSLLATRLAGRLSQAFHTAVSVIRMFDHPTIETQARLLSNVNIGAAMSLVVAAPANSAEDRTSRQARARQRRMSVRTP